jgi:Flp pilus assembly protein TadD
MIGYPSALAPFARALPNSGPIIASLPARTAAEHDDVEKPRSITRELAANRKIHKRRRRGRRSGVAKRIVRVPSSWSADDTAADENDGAMPDDGAETDDAAVTPAVPVSPAVKGLVRAETREGDAHMARGDYDIALRKFRTALVLDPTDDAVREKIERAEQATEPSEEMTR